MSRQGKALASPHQEELDVEAVLEEENELEAGEPQNRRSLSEWLNTTTPWWVVSVVLHVLTIAFLALVTISIGKVDEEERVVTVMQMPAKDTTPERKPPDVHQAEEAAKLTDPLAQQVVNFEFPPELAAEISDRILTNNPELEDTHRARGSTLDSHIILKYSNTSEVSGGGVQGATLMDDVIGYSGSGSPGSNGGWGGGDGGGMGDGHGNGFGGYGTRTDASRKFSVLRSCRNLAPYNTVNRALAWLAKHQEPDGHWDTKKYGSNEKTDTAMTGAALLCFLGAGHTEKVGQYKTTVQKAVAWLIAHQDKDGLVFDKSDAGGHRGVGYPHALASMALAEAAGMARIPATRDAAQKAVDYSCHIHQQGDDKDEYGVRGAWRYAAKSKPDTSVTGWFVMQLKSAKISGLNVPQSSFDGAIKYLDRVEHKEAGGDSAYGLPSTYWYMEDKQFGHGNTHARLSAIGNLARQFLGWKRNELQASVEKLVRDGGLPSADKTDLYYWYYGSMCTFQQGGAVWEEWNKAMSKTLVESNRQGGDEDGSWDPQGDFSAEWGRVGQTAMACLCLEVYYRFKMVGSH